MISLKLDMDELEMAKVFANAAAEYAAGDMVHVYEDGIVAMIACSEGSAEDHAARIKGWFGPVHKARSDDGMYFAFLVRGDNAGLPPAQERRDLRVDKKFRTLVKGRWLDHRFDDASTIELAVMLLSRR